VTDRLPETTDPYLLLGVSPDAGEAAIRDAYARRLAVHRTADDRARLRTAFARAVAGVGGDPSFDPAPGGADDAAPAPDAPHAIATVTVDDPVALATAQHARYAALARARSYAALAAEVTEPVRLAAARTHPALAGAALRALGGLAWHIPTAAAYLQAFADLPPEWGLGPLVDHVTGEIAIATRWRAAVSRGALLDRGGGSALPSTLTSLVGDPLLASAEQRQATFTEVVGLLAQPYRMLAACDRLVVVDRDLANLLITRLRSESPLWGPRALDPLPATVRDRLGELMVELRGKSIARLFATPTLVAAGVVGAVLGAGVAVAGGADQDALMAALVVGGGPAAASLIARDSLSRRQYLRRLRFELAAIIAHLGVQADCTSAWVRTRPRLARHLRSHVHSIESDTGLALLGAIAAVAQEAIRSGTGTAT
jgi:hypothetical protein